MGRSAFRCCRNLQSIKIPTSVEDIGIVSSISFDVPEAFEGCTHLTDIYYKGTIQQWADMLKIQGIKPSKITVHCSDGDLTGPDRRKWDKNL